MTSPKPEIISSEKTETQLAPRYAVILWDSPDHSFDYVIEMMRRIFGMSAAEGMEVAVTVHTEGRAACGAFPLEEAEMKRDKIHAYGADTRIPHCKGSMYATLERLDD